jgi:hypothetical protein
MSVPKAGAAKSEKGEKEVKATVGPKEAEVSEVDGLTTAAEVEVGEEVEAVAVMLVGVAEIRAAVPTAGLAMRGARADRSVFLGGSAMVPMPVLVWLTATGNAGAKVSLWATAAKEEAQGEFGKPGSIWGKETVPGETMEKAPLRQAIGSRGKEARVPPECQERVMLEQGRSLKEASAGAPVSELA